MSMYITFGLYDVGSVYMETKSQHELMIWKIAKWTRMKDDTRDKNNGYNSKSMGVLEQEKSRDVSAAS